MHLLAVRCQGPAVREARTSGEKRGPRAHFQIA